MRLLFINPNRSVVHGGVERWMIDAAAGLQARGHTTLLFGRPGTAWLEAAQHAGLRVCGGIRGAWVQRVLRVWQTMLRERPDLVITKGTKQARMASWGRTLGVRARVVEFFGATHELDPRKWIYRHTWRRIDAGIVVAHGAARWYAQQGFGPPGKMHVLWKGIDLARFDAAAARTDATREALGLRSGDLAVGTVGRLAWQKGIDDLFAAIRLVRARIPRARFFVAGGGRDADTVAAAAADLGSAVTLLGPRDDVPELLAAMDVVVQSSKREAMAQTTLEAMAVGRPVVSTTTIGADEAIEEGVSGLLVPVGDVAALADRIAALAGDPARRAALGAAARARIAAHFTQAHMLDRCEAIFARIAHA